MAICIILTCMLLNDPLELLLLWLWVIHTMCLSNRYMENHSAQQGCTILYK